MASHYAEGVGRGSIPPGRYFRMLLIGYFGGIGSQRGIALPDSLSLRQCLFLQLHEDSPDHSSPTRVRDRLPLEVHEQVFVFVLVWPSSRCCWAGPWRWTPPRWKPMRP